MKRPTIFLSSTIYDFRDLRSALKYHLEQQGCTVLASEFNDFQKPLDAHSYDACLSAIEKADYFILLVGSRVGGWYDSIKRISITQQEYRAAYDLHKRGRLNILAFVRSEVWQVREDRKALERHLETLELEDSEKHGVMAYPSKFANNAEFISSFIDEIGRNKETKQAVEQGTMRPTGNWIHVFKDFDEIVSAIRPLLFGGLPIEEAAFRKALEAELLEVLAQCFFKYKGAALSPIGGIFRVRQICPIRTKISEGDIITMPANEWDAFSTLFFQLLGTHLNVIVLPDALSSSTFLQFDVATGVFLATAVSRAIAQLIKEIRRFNEANTEDTLSLVFAHTPRVRPRNLTAVDLDAVRLARLYHLAFRWANIVILCEALLHYLQTGRFKEPELFPFSPIEGFDEKLNEEKLSAEEVSVYLAGRRTQAGET